jgi:hypothetical protein
VVAAPEKNAPRTKRSGHGVVPGVKNPCPVQNRRYPLATRRWGWGWGEVFVDPPATVEVKDQLIEAKPKHPVTGGS